MHFTRIAHLPGHPCRVVFDALNTRLPSANSFLPFYLCLFVLLPPPQGDDEVHHCTSRVSGHAGVGHDAQHQGGPCQRRMVEVDAQPVRLDASCVPVGIVSVSFV